MQTGRPSQHVIGPWTIPKFGDVFFGGGLLLNMCTYVSICLCVGIDVLMCLQSIILVCMIMYANMYCPIPATFISGTLRARLDTRGWLVTLGYLIMPTLKH